MRRLAAILFLVSATAGAHSVMTAPVPRNNFDDVKVGSATHPAPCGGPRGTVVLSKNVGDQLQVEWDETIDHPGHYEILFSNANDQNFTFVTDPNGATMNNITDVQGGTLPHHYKQMIKLPATPAAAGTLQLKQFMSETSTYYHSCADMELKALGVDGGVPPSPMPDVDMGSVPQNQPADPMMNPSTPPETQDPAPMNSPPDMAVATTAKNGEIGPTQYDYSYGCSMSTGDTSLFAFLLVLSGLGIARSRSRYRSRRQFAARERNR